MRYTLCVLFCVRSSQYLLFFCIVIRYRSTAIIIIARVCDVVVALSVGNGAAFSSASIVFSRTVCGCGYTRRHVRWENSSIGFFAVIQLRLAATVSIAPHRRCNVRRFVLRAAFSAHVIVLTTPFLGPDCRRCCVPENGAVLRPNASE